MIPLYVFLTAIVTVLALLLADAWARNARRRRRALARARARPAKQEPPQEEESVPLPRIEYEEDADVDPTRLGVTPRGAALSPPAHRILYDEDASNEEPTQASPLILVTATAQSDRGLRRRRNEDRVLVLKDHGVFVVADGMGGYHGGEVASHLAVKTIERAFVAEQFDGPPHQTIPRRASELARAIQMANEAILSRASADKQLSGMGTTVCAARFALNKQRLYVGHVGDSRAYRLRGGTLRQMTSDHTMQGLGVKGDGAAHLSRAVGIWPTVPVDIILGKPKPGDVYLFCSDGLTKMVEDREIAAALATADLKSAVERLIQEANEQGGKDNVSVIVVRVEDPGKRRVAA